MAVLTVYTTNTLQHITYTMMINVLRDTVVAIGEDSLEFKKESVGTHSIRSGSAMSMYLGECPVYTIMMIGRWSSDAFLRYIRKQVEQFSNNVSKRMLKFQHHRHILEMAPMTANEDPRQRNHPCNAETRRNI
eukprot:10869707-Ditylum_brightwellii.AAC.1